MTTRVIIGVPHDVHGEVTVRQGGETHIIGPGQAVTLHVWRGGPQATIEESLPNHVTAAIGAPHYTLPPEGIDVT